MSVRLRPRFRLIVDLHQDAVMEIFESHAANAPCALNFYEHQVEFSVRPEHRHFWSPFLNLIVEEHEGETTLFGKYGPNTNVWTMFMGIYAVLGIVGGFGFVLGLSQMQLGQANIGFYLAISTAVAALVVYVAGRLGQRLAEPQMHIFHAFIESAFADHILQMDDEAET